MQDFNPLFDSWASSYDETVYGHDNEYSEVFSGYAEILEYICQGVRGKEGTIIEIGVGTGNLTKMLYDHGLNIVGIEPSQEMRKIAQSKLPSVKILDGHFLSIPVRGKVDAIVTSYALHHLTLDEKREALRYLDGLLNENGKMIIADTMFESEAYKENLLEYVRDCGTLNLLKDLNSEYYEYVDDLCQLFREMNYTYEIIKMNKYVWMISAVKGGLFI
jgi:ubiquinone/menaquinone biosynthesis C-methylase UbiE